MCALCTWVLHIYCPCLTSNSLPQDCGRGSQGITLYTPFNLYCPGHYTIHLQNLIVTVHVTVSAFSSLVVVYIPEMLVSSLNLSLNQSYECRHVHVYLEFIFKS